jgi:long-chain fatty acid transport protein
MLRAVLAFFLLFASLVQARPYPGISGIAAPADSSATAGNNPAGMTRLDERTWQVEVLSFFSESTWDGQFDDVDFEYSSSDSSTTVVPMGSFVQPIGGDWRFGFTVLGFSVSDDLGEWPGRYFIQEYESLYINAYPSIAYRISDRFSIAGSVALSYSTFDQERAVANVLDPGFGEGSSEIETDGFDVGFGASLLYEHSPRTRFGLVYNSELDPELDGDNSFSGLGPNTQEVLESSGLYGADVTVLSKSPQSLVGGVYHEFENNHAWTLDLAWIDFSEFQLSEFYFNGEALASAECEYEDIYAFTTSYSFPVSSRWMLGVSGFYVDDMIKDDNRTFTLRLDSLWGFGLGAEWQWDERRKVEFSASYIEIGDAPVTGASIPGIGSLGGSFSDRQVIQLQVALKFGAH